ncbi:MAG TPA: OstA-like protein, partial [Ferruginibacter sp.]|nr:OstA-like protein [Ferruginibacter sp.]
MTVATKILLFFAFVCIGIFAQAQTITTPVADTSDKRIEIIQARSMRQITTDTGTVWMTLAGDAKVRQANTILMGDSISMNQATGIVEVFGHVHINDGDTVHTYAEYLRYVGDERMAYLKRSVKLTDGKAILTTEDLVYNLQTGIATYQNGGKVINGKTVLTSQDAVYYSDTKDVIFKKDVHLVDPKYDMHADSLRYNTEFKEAYFISPTHIVSTDGVLDTNAGTYNLETGEAVFLGKTIFRDSTRLITGNKMAMDDKNGIIQIEERGKYVDSVNRIIVLGDQILHNKRNNTTLATRKPVMIIYRDNDSTYIAADTLFSGIKKRVRKDSLTTTPNRDSMSLAKSDSLPRMNRDTIITAPTLVNASQAPVANADSVRIFMGFHHVRIYNDSIQAVADSLYYTDEDSTFRLFKDPVFWSHDSQVTGDTMILFTEKQQPKLLQVYYKAMMVNRTREGLFNQMGGRTIHAYFKDGSMDYARVKGSPAESIYYAQDDDSAYIGLNRSKGDVIDVYFLNKELQKVKFINDVSGTLYPMRQIP